MANVKKIELWIGDSIVLFMNHWKYGHNYEDSVILMDWQNNIIAFYDRKTENIDTIMADLPHPWGFIIGDNYWYEIDWTIKYKPYDYEMARLKYKTDMAQKMKDGESVEWLWEDTLKWMKDYNINYFDNIRGSFWKWVYAYA